MASTTLVQAQLGIQNTIVAGVAQDIISIDPMYNLLPFIPYSGQAVLVNRESVLGDAAIYGVDATITAKNPSQIIQTPYTAISIIGDAELNGLVRAQSASAGVDQMAREISSKAKSIGRTFRQGLATGAGGAGNLNSYHSLCDASQYTTASLGQALSFQALDELLDLVLAKDGDVDFIVMHSRTLRSYRALLRSLGGNTMERIQMADGRIVDSYGTIPIFRNDYLPTTETANGAALTGGALTSVWAGCFDDGSEKIGVGVIHPEGTPAGLDVEVIGKLEGRDAELVRVKQYAQNVLFNRRGLARLTSISN
jgi:hypothetical protein